MAGHDDTKSVRKNIRSNTIVSIAEILSQRTNILFSNILQRFFIILTSSLSHFKFTKVKKGSARLSLPFNQNTTSHEKELFSGLL